MLNYNQGSKKTFISKCDMKDDCLTVYEASIYFNFIKSEVRTMTNFIKMPLQTAMEVIIPFVCFSQLMLRLDYFQQF